MLYAGGEIDADILATRNMFEKALRVLELGEKLSEKLPYMNLPTVAGRIQAAGIEPESVRDALLAAAESNPVRLSPQNAPMLH